MVKSSGWLEAIRSWLQSSEVAAGLLLSVVVGLVSGLGAVAFRWLVSNFHTLFFDGGGQVLAFLSDYYIILIPAIGGLLVGPIIYFLAREARGHGVPEVMEAVAMRGGRIRPRVSIIKALASAITIGSGGSVGREGPIVQIGASIGSTVSQWLKLPDETMKVLVACGAAGGIAATFNAPIAGVFFALEVIMGRVVTRRFGYVVISAVLADFIAQAFLGNTRAFPVPDFGIVSGWEFLLYVVLGVLTAFAARAFIIVLYKSEDIFNAWKIPDYVKPAIGGLAVGAMGLYSLYLMGVGYEGISGALGGEMSVTVLLLLLVMKVAATSITIGSGGSGGIFAPSLFMGAMLGTTVGLIFGQLFPSITAPAGAFGVVGMAAMLAGTARAPFAAILIIFEMTGDYSIILPLMTAVVISMAVGRAIHSESIYALKLLRRGVDISHIEMSDVMRDVTVKEAMTRDFPTVPAGMKLEAVIKLFQSSGHHGFPVVDEDGRLVGVITESDLLHRMDTAAGTRPTAADIATQRPFVAYPDQNLDRLLEAIDETEARIPVVSREDSQRLLGVIGRHEIISAYRRKKKQRFRSK